MIGLGGFLVGVWALTTWLYGKHEDDEGLVGRSARAQLAAAQVALVAGLAILLVGLLAASVP